MRIAVIYLGRRGSGCRIALELARRLCAGPDGFAVISDLVENRAAWQSTEINLIEVRPFGSTIQAARSWLDRRPVHHLVEQIADLQPDVLLFPMFHPWNPLLQDMLSGLPSVVWLHDPLPHPGMGNWVIAQVENWSLQRATRVVVLSQRFIPVAMRRGARDGYVDVIPHGIIYSGTAPKSQETRLEKPLVLNFGRITPYKGIDILLRAFRLVQDRHPNVRLRLAGEGDLAPYKSLLRALSQVEVLNYWIPEEEISAVFQDALLVTLPYTSASQSGVVALAAGNGLPVVATRVGALPEQVQDGVTGLLVTPGSEEELAEAICRLLEDPPLAARLGQALREDFVLHRSWEMIAAKTREICAQAIRDHVHQRKLGLG